MAGIVLSIEVDDKGTVKVKQFSDETKKAFDQMKKGPQEAAGSLNSLRDSWVGVTAKIGIATAAFYAAKRLIYDTAVQIASATNEIERQAAVLGISTDEFQRWTYAAKMADVNSQELAIGMKMLSRNMEDAAQGSGDAAKYLSGMGISVKTTGGHLRPLNDVMGDIMDKFSSWEDGPRKIAIAMQLFGRSGETLIPLLNKGKSGFQEMAAEAQRLGIILSPNLIRAGSEAEDAFKRINAQLDATKKSFAPAAKAMADFLEPVLAVVNLISAGIGKIKEFSDSIEKWKYKSGLGSVEYEKKLSAAEMTRETAEYYRNIEKMKIKAPEIAGTGAKAAKEEDPLSAYNAIIQKANEWGEVVVARQELAEMGWSEEKDIVVQAREELERLERETNAWGEITVARQELVETGWKKITMIDEIVRKAAGVRTDQAVQEIEKITESQRAWTTLSENISSAWNFNVTGILRGTATIKDSFKNMVNGMVDSFISGISKMISQWLLFGSITGKTESGGGFLTGGSWSGLLGSLITAQEGFSGWINKPTAFLAGEGGEREHINITPESKMSKQSGGDTYIVVMPHDYDKSFADKIERNPGSIVEILRKNVRKSGGMKDIIRGATQ